VLDRWSVNPAADLKRATELAQKALTLDDSNGTALSQLCEIYWMQQQFDRAVAEGERCVAINPNYPICYQALADALMAAARPEDAVGAAQKAIRLDPQGGDFYAFFIGAAYVQMGRYQEAIPFLKKNSAAYPGEPWVHMSLVVAYSELGRKAEARAEASEILRVNPQFALPPVTGGKNVALNRRFNDDLRKAGLK
jgi:adenylate cyclase